MTKHRRSRSARDLRRNAPKRSPFVRLLIVCEGEKTEVNYFEEIRQILRISTINICVIHSDLGTEPKQIVQSAETEFLKTRSFEKVFAVFDRDEHRTYFDAISMAEARDKKFKNDEGKSVDFCAIASVPCFELWLLIHFQEVLAPIHRHDALKRLQGYIASYEKGNNNTFAMTRNFLEIASERAKALQARFSRISGEDPYTDVHVLVGILRSMKQFF